MDQRWNRSGNWQWQLWLAGLGCLGAGVVAGALSLMVLGPEAVEGLNEYFNTSLASLVEGATAGSQVTWLALRNNLIVLVLIWFLGLTIVGTPLIMLVIAARGFAIGFTVAFLVETRAFQGVLMALLAVLPPNIFSLPVLLAGSVAAVSFCRGLVASRGDLLAPLGRRLFGYAGTLALFVPVLVAASLVEAYFAPWAMRIVLAYF